MPDHENIYRNEAQQYELLISREDYQQNVMKAMTRILPTLDGLAVVDIGAGTGKLACLLAPYVKSILATDISQAMLDVAAEKLKSRGVTNWRIKVADNRSLPIPDHSVDVLTAGWTICYFANTHVKQWKHHVETVIAEMQRVLPPSGTAIIMENFGTGSESPNPPDFLKSYYHLLETEYGFSHETIRTDFKFQSIEESEQLSRFFFGDGLGDWVRDQHLLIVPECTGVWWKKFN